VGRLLMNRKIKIDMDVFLMGFSRDVDFHNSCPQSVFLDLDNGEVLWVYEEDDDASFDGGIPEAENKANRERISNTPERYLEIPGFDHGDHHQILRDFLESEWTDDKELWQNDSIFYAYYRYRDSVMREEAIGFLNNHGIEPIDKI